MNRDKLIDHLLQSALLGAASYGLTYVEKIGDKLDLISQTLIKIELKNEAEISRLDEKNKSQDQRIEGTDVMLKDHETRIRGFEQFKHFLRKEK